MNTLFPIPAPAPTKGRPPREGWERLSPPGNKCFATYRHEASGWLVRHCGHPTANYPYYATKPGDDRTVVTHNGKGWRTCELAFLAVEAVLNGSLRVTDSRCGARTLRVTTEDDDHEN